MRGVGGVLEQRVGEVVVGVGAAHLGVDVLVAVFVEVGEADAVALLQVTEVRCRRHVNKAVPAHVEEGEVGLQRFVRRASRAQVQVGEAVGVEVADRRAHGEAHHVHAQRSVTSVNVPPGSLRKMRRVSVGMSMPRMSATYGSMVRPKVASSGEACVNCVGKLATNRSLSPSWS